MLKKINLRNKTALVTGAGKGLGKACAIALAEAGAKVVILSRTKSDLTKVNKIIKNLVSDPKKKNKLIFDGYPRSLSQAKNLNSLLEVSNQKIDLILFLNVDKETIIKRIEKRKIIENRSDDDLNTILKRYDTYMKTTQPVLNFYSENSNFKEIDGSLEIDEITRKIDTFINV